MVPAAAAVLEALLPGLPHGGHQFCQQGIVGVVRADVDHFFGGFVHCRPNLVLGCRTCYGASQLELCRSPRMY